MEGGDGSQRGGGSLMPGGSHFCLSSLLCLVCYQHEVKVDSFDSHQREISCSHKTNVVMTAGPGGGRTESNLSGH